MSKTKIEIIGEHFYINGRKTYSEIENNNKNVHGLLMNARFIQGIFDDKADKARFNRFGKIFDPEQNTDDLIKALPEWYSYGLRAFTVGLQGGGPCFTTDNASIDNNPFSEDGKSIDTAYLKRLDRLINAADEIGMIVIVSIFYHGQAKRMKNDITIINGVIAACDFLRSNAYTNVMIEVANEYDIGDFKSHPIINTPIGITGLINLAKKHSDGILVGCSGTGGHINSEVCLASDYILIHGNGCSRQMYYNLIQKARMFSPDKPVVCNEDSQAIGQLDVAFRTNSSWGYYNNLTKQEPPANWAVTEGEDRFFAYRMAMGLGIDVSPLKMNEQYYLQGLELDIQCNGKRWISVASLYPESINYVEFFINNKHIYTCYDESFSLNFNSNWHQSPIEISNEDVIGAKIYLRDSKVIKK